MKRLIIVFLSVASFTGCKKDVNIDKEISKIKIDLTVERFDQIFIESKSSDLPALKKTFPFLFSNKYPDSLWIEKMADTLEIQLANEVNRSFSNLEDTREEIKLLFQHLKFYFPEFKTPRVITVTSNVDYRNKVIVTDSIVLIALDNYLGRDHEFYQSIPQYKVNNFNKDQITPDLATEYGKKYAYQPERRTFLDEMIYSGKLLYFKDVVLPLKSDSEKIGYSNEQLNWAMTNEGEVWRYFIENEMLFDTNSELLSRFINPAPFSKFYLNLDHESPGKIGQYIGWQIVKAYMKNNNDSFTNMLIKGANEIYEKSKFKPRK
jgi:gliding motility-associated lipoprotein GldB